MLAAALGVALRAAPEDVCERVFAAWRRGDTSLETQGDILANVFHSLGRVTVRVPCMHASPACFGSMEVSID